MPDIQFFQTRMGQRFYESTLPELVRQLTRLNDLLARLVAAGEARVAQSDSGTDAP